MGDSVLAGAVKVKAVRDALSAEAMACLFALESAAESNWKWTAASYGRRSLHKAEIWPLAVSCSGVSESYFMIILFIVIVNVPQSYNSSAHEIAKLAFSWDLGQSNVWHDPLPEFVNTAKGFTAQWQRPLVGGLPPRVQILGAALYSGFIPEFFGAMH